MFYAHALSLNITLRASGSPNPVKRLEFRLFPLPTRGPSSAEPTEEQKHAVIARLILSMSAFSPSSVLNKHVLPKDVANSILITISVVLNIHDGVAEFTERAALA